MMCWFKGAPQSIMERSLNKLVSPVIFNRDLVFSFQKVCLMDGKCPVLSFCTSLVERLEASTSLFPTHHLHHLPGHTRKPTAFIKYLSCVRYFPHSKSVRANILCPFDRSETWGPEGLSNLIRAEWVERVLKSWALWFHRTVFWFFPHYTNSATSEGNLEEFLTQKTFPSSVSFPSHVWEMEEEMREKAQEGKDSQSLSIQMHGFPARIDCSGIAQIWGNLPPRTSPFTPGTNVSHHLTWISDYSDPYGLFILPRCGQWEVELKGFQRHKNENKMGGGGRGVSRLTFFPKSWVLKGKFPSVK